MHKLPVKCPSCQSPLEVSSLACTNCETQIKGAYALPVMLQLSQDEQDFIYDFIVSGGSLKAMAKQLGKSYPTVRNKLDDLIDHLQQLKTQSNAQY